MRLTAQQVYDKLINDDRILEIEGRITFDFGDVNITVEYKKSGFAILVIYFVCFVFFKTPYVNVHKHIGMFSVHFANRFKTVFIKIQLLKHIYHLYSTLSSVKTPLELIGITSPK